MSEVALSSGELGQLVDALASSLPELRSSAVRRAAEELPPELLVALVIRDVPVAVRSGAMDALRFMGDRALLAIRAGAMQPGHGSIFCLQLLGWHEDDAGYELLCRTAVEGSVLHRQAAIDALGMRANGRALPLFEAALKDEPWVAMAAVMALEGLDDPRAEAALERVSGDPFLGAAATDVLARKASRRERTR